MNDIRMIGGKHNGRYHPRSYRAAGNTKLASDPSPWGWIVLVFVSPFIAAGAAWLGQL